MGWWGRNSLVKLDGLCAVDVVPPVAGQLVLVEDGAVGAQERGARVAVTVILLADVVRLQRSGQVRWVTGDWAAQVRWARGHGTGQVRSDLRQSLYLSTLHRAQSWSSQNARDQSVV